MRASKILIPLDGSAFSRSIFAQVRRLLPPERHALVLLRVADEPVGVAAAPRQAILRSGMLMQDYLVAEEATFAQHPIFANQVASSEQAWLEDELRKDAKALADYDIRVAVRFGDPAEEIVNVVADDGIDLIAMATHGRTGLRHLVMGSVAEEVLRRAPVPVLLVGPHGEVE